MTLDKWLPTDRQHKPKPAAPPNVAQMRLRLKRARLITENAQNETSKRMADRLIQAWEPANMIAMALEDLNSSSALLRKEAMRFLEVCTPDVLADQSGAK